MIAAILITIGVIIILFALFYTIDYNTAYDQLSVGDKYGPKVIKDPFKLKSSDILTIISKENSNDGRYILASKNGKEVSMKYSKFHVDYYKLPEESRFNSKRVMKTM